MKPATLKAALLCASAIQVAALSDTAQSHQDSQIQTLARRDESVVAASSVSSGAQDKDTTIIVGDADGVATTEIENGKRPETGGEGPSERNSPAQKKPSSSTSQEEAASSKGSAKNGSNVSVPSELDIYFFSRSFSKPLQSRILRQSRLQRGSSRSNPSFSKGQQQQQLSLVQRHNKTSLPALLAQKALHLTQRPSTSSHPPRIHEQLPQRHQRKLGQPQKSLSLFHQPTVLLAKQTLNKRQRQPKPPAPSNRLQDLPVLPSSPLLP